MYIDWTKHLKDEEEKKKFEQNIFGSKEVLDRLRDILNEYGKSLERSETSIEIYDLPNWDYRQAHKNGYRACLTRIMELVNLDQQRKTQK